MQNHCLVTYPELKRLGSYLVEAGLLTQVQIDVALADQEATGVRFGDILVLRGWIKEQTIEYFMRKLVLPEREVPEREPSAQPASTPELPAKLSSSENRRRSPPKQQQLFGTFREDDGRLG